MGKTKEVKAVRNYKDTVFRMLFREKGNLLELYNALNGTSYGNADELEVATLDNAVYMNVKNDVSFIFRSYLMLYEHQSTYSPNLPLRDLIYVSKQYEKYIVGDSIYSSHMAKVPAPKFVVFYNGTQGKPEETVLNLSDAYEVKEENPDLELKVRMININPGYNSGLVKSCRTLHEYCLYVECVRKYAALMPIAEAVDKAVNECIRKDILSDFLIRQRAEVVAMSILEYDEEVDLKKLRDTEYRFGLEEGEKIGEKRGERRGEKRGERRGEKRGRRKGILIGEQNGRVYIIVSLLCSKLEKQYTVEKISEELEMPEKSIETLCEIAEKYKPDYDVEKICKEVINKCPELVKNSLHL